MSNRTLAGIALVILGTLLLMSNFGIRARFPAASFWPLLLALVGAMFIRDALRPGGERSHVFVGVIILGIGIMYFLKAIGLIRIGMGKLWPVYLVIVGIAFFAQAAAMNVPHYSGTGALLCGVGIILLAFNLRLVDYGIFREAVKYWPVLIIAAGVLKLVDSYR
ncbi:MAG: DUF5668 domain-containing protein [Bacillota bacterium]|jgi:hypothetical protein|nr:DUF5668 domain-containing protein [Bacillota bacterium]HOK71542.1 DUF5668 domain-containing protein [Bacillota bacterium]HOL51888.1 DUF5668 domain-containing protein [Bacillota bacterium]HOO30408.1 DUF5668 domain-containing protein [Bacillota bacterium]HPQ01808.1 DUF5668 domain-containing protein [Bacillota bacterium]